MSEIRNLKNTKLTGQQLKFIADVWHNEPVASWEFDNGVFYREDTAVKVQIAYSEKNGFELYTWE